MYRGRLSAFHYGKELTQGGVGLLCSKCWMTTRRRRPWPGSWMRWWRLLLLLRLLPMIQLGQQPEQEAAAAAAAAAAGGSASHSAVG